MLSRQDFYPLVRPLALVAVLAVVALWDRAAPIQSGASALPAVHEEEPAAPKMNGQQLSLAHEQCDRKASAEFRRAWKDGVVSTAEWKEVAAFSSHYNGKQDVCFYLLEVVRQAPAEAILLRKMLYDVNERELYGEYRGPESGGAPGAGMPEVCRVENLYCASQREWERLAETYMEARAEVR